MIKQKEIVDETKNQPLFIVDCNNICHINKKTIDTDRLSKVLDEIKAIGDYLAFYSGRLRTNINDDFFKRNPQLINKAFIFVQNGNDPDLFMLEAATKFGSYIITCDNFRQYKELYPETIKRRIPFIIVKSNSINTALIPGLRSINQ